MLLKNKTISLMQPTYIPWLGYFNLIKKSDEFILLTSTQLSKRSWQTRNRIKTKNGILMLTIPIKKTRTREKTLIKDAEVMNELSWQENHLKSIKHSYSKSPFFDQIYPSIFKILSKKSSFLIDYSIPLIEFFIEKLDIKTKVIVSDKISYTGFKDEALVSICKKRKANCYLSVEGSKDYILSGENLFDKNNIKLVWNTYNHPNYNQLHDSFISHLSIIDSLFMLGFEQVKKLI